MIDQHPQAWSRVWKWAETRHWWLFNAVWHLRCEKTTPVAGWMRPSFDTIRNRKEMRRRCALPRWHRKACLISAGFTGRDKFLPFNLQKDVK